MTFPRFKTKFLKYFVVKNCFKNCLVPCKQHFTNETCRQDAKRLLTVDMSEQTFKNFKNTSVQAFKASTVILTRL